MRSPPAPLEPRSALAAIVALLLFGDLFLPWYTYSINDSTYPDTGWRAQMLDRTLVIAVAAGFVFYVAAKTWTVLETPTWSLAALLGVTVLAAAVVGYRQVNPPPSEKVAGGGFIALVLCGILLLLAHGMRQRERDARHG